MKNNNINYSVYLVTDSELIKAQTLEDAVEQAIIGGCTVVQLREKELDSGDFYDKAMNIKKITDKYNIPLIINDRLDIALAVGADGVHIGQRDLPARVVRKIVGENMIIGVSVQNVEQAIKAVEDGTDYLGVGAMFATDTKKDADLTTIDELNKICKEVDVPIIVIGGINERTIPLFDDVPIQGVSVVSAILSKDDVTAATRMISELFNKNRKNRKVKTEDRK